MIEPQPQTGAGRLKALYVSILLRMLPLLTNCMRHLSAAVQSEVDYLASGYTYLLRVRGTTLSGACQKTGRGGFRRVAPAALAKDVEAGSGLPSADPQAVTVNYVIEFRSLDYAFRCFSGGMSLKRALAERAFTTRGPNDTGVALTYMFTALLKSFFFWRSAYSGKVSSSGAKASCARSNSARSARSANVSGAQTSNVNQ